MSKNSFNLDDNPLVNPPAQPFNAPPMGLVKPEHAEPAVDHTLVIARKNIDAIVNNTDTPTFENTIHALAFADEDLGRAVGPFYEMSSALNTPDVQDVMKKITPKLVQYSVEVTLNEGLFKKIKTVYDSADRSTMSTEERTLLEDTYNSYINNGALLQGAQRDEYEQLSQTLAVLTKKYGDNLVNSTAELKVVIKAQDKQRLAGIPADIIASYQQNAQEDQDPAVTNDDYVIPMAPPPMDVYEYADDRTLREEVAHVADKIGSAAPYDNTQIVLDILDTQHKLAQLLGFKNHAEKTIRPDTRMAENPQNVLDFLEKNTKAYLPVAKKFYQELRDFAQDRDGIQTLKGWDKLYYIRLLREKQIDFDPEEMRPYFELENVIDGIFKHSEKLYGIKRQKADSKYTKIHKDASIYEAINKKTGDVKALYSLDPYARKFKNGGAWMSDTRNAGMHNGQQEIPIVGNYCNFNKPVPGKPTLLYPNEVTTLFHEDGHACHGMMGKGTYPDITGPNVHWDYVELPSQINERWAFKPEVLATYAKHHETGAPIPAHLVDKLQKLAHFDAQWQGIRQTELGLLDMALYTTDPATIGTDLKAFQDKVWAATEIIKPSGSAFVLSFNHIVAGGYSAGYYSYKMADALVADVFEQFNEQGLYKPSLCAAFADKMVEPGGTKPPADMHKDFMEAAGQGRRELDQDALFRAEGILPPKKPPTPKAP